MSAKESSIPINKQTKKTKSKNKTRPNLCSHILTTSQRKRQKIINEVRNINRYDTVLIKSFITRITEELKKENIRSSFKFALKQRKGYLIEISKELLKIEKKLRQCYHNISDKEKLTKLNKEKNALNQDYIIAVEYFQLWTEIRSFCKNKHSENNSCVICEKPKFAYYTGKYMNYSPFEDKLNVN